LRIISRNVRKPNRLISLKHEQMIAWHVDMRVATLPERLKLKRISPMNVTEKAKKELSKLEIGGGNFLRLSVIPGGCSGMTYTAALDQRVTDEDEVLYEDGDLKIVGAAGSLIFLEDVTIDFSDDLIRSGFRFTNPNAKGSCGCGASFAG